MKFNFKKISAIATSVLMVGFTFGVVSAANYPAPFVEGSATNVAVVFGTGAGVSSIDHIEATNIFSDLQSRTTGTSSTDASIIGGDSRSLNSGSDRLYLNDDLGENVQTLTKDDLATVLADGTFTDDDGTDYDYSQTITVGATNTFNEFEFGNSDNDYDDPTLMLAFETSANPIYNLTITFDKTCNLSASTSEGEEITLFGKMYTIGTATDVDTIVLLGGSESTSVNVGETVTVTVDGVSYDVSLTGITDATTAVAAVTVNGESKTFTAGQTKTLGGVDVYVKEINRWSDNSGEVKIQLGADKLTFEDGNTITYGSSNTEIEGTLIDLNSVGAFSSMTIAVYAPDNDANDLLVGETFIDPIFGSVKIDFASIYYGPTFTAEEDTGRTELKMISGGDRELQLYMTNKNGLIKTLPFVYQGGLTDDASQPIYLVEGKTMDLDDYFILNSGNYEHFMQLTKVDADASGEVKIKDLFTGETHTTGTQLDFTAAARTITINNQVYTVTRVSDTSVTVTSSDYATGNGVRALFPYLELDAANDYPRVALTDDVAVGNNVYTTTNDVAAYSPLYQLPTGSIQFRINDSNVATNATLSEAAYQIIDTSTGSWTNVSAWTRLNATAQYSFPVGEAYYAFNLTFASNSTAGNASLTVDSVAFDTVWAAHTTAVGKQTYPGIMLVQEKDKSNSDKKSVVFFNTTDDAAYSELDTVLFSDTVNTGYDTQAWDETKLTGYITNYGTYVLKDTTDTNQHLARLTYTFNQMYADVYFAEEGTVITPGSGGSTGGTFTGIVVMDTEVSSVATKNLIIVGGSCINSAAAALVGGAYCGQAWTDATGIEAGQFLIKGYTDSSLTSGLALLVAGYHVDDTKNAATYLRNKVPDTSSTWKGSSATNAESFTVPA